jgi:hypothetical protein
MHRHLTILLLTIFFLPRLVLAATLPSAQEILTSVRLQQSEQQIDLQGQLRENEKVIPFHLIQTGSLIRYEFINPSEAFTIAVR